MMQRAHRGTRRSLLTPALLSLGALALFAAAPAAAQTQEGVWAADLTVDENTHQNGTDYGCGTNANLEACSKALSNRYFTYKGVRYEVTGVYTEASGGDWSLNISFWPNTPGSDGMLYIRTEAGPFSRNTARALSLSNFSDSGSTFTLSSSGVNWDNRPRIWLALVLHPKVSLSASPSTIKEGRKDEPTTTATVTATLDSPWNASADVVFRVAAANGTAENGDWYISNPNILIRRGESTGTTTIQSRHDGDEDDETVLVSLPSTLPCGVGRQLESCLVSGSVTSATITIDDDDAGGGQVNPPNKAAVKQLTASPNPVDEGDPVTVTATLTKALSSDVTIPLTLTDVTAEAGDRGTLAGITVTAGQTTGEGTISTNPDEDEDDETFTVGMDVDNLPREIEGVIHRPITVTITDDPYAALIAKIRTWRNDPRYKHDKRHTDRWDRVLLAFGKTVADNTLTPMTAAEAQGYADRGWTRWVEVAEALREIEAEQTGGDRVPGTVVASELAQALALVDGVGAEDAAAALFDGQSLDAARLEALDRLGNANGRYDVGDLLSWIDRCRGGGATCGTPPGTTTPASDAALPAAAGALGAGAVPRRPRRRAPGGRRPRRRSGARMPLLGVLLAAVLWSCDGAGVVDLPAAADVPEPGTLAVEWTAPAGAPAVAGALVEIDGPDVADARAPGLELYESEGTGPRRFVIAGGLRTGPVLEFHVPDRRQAHLYSVRVVEVAGQDHRLLDTGDYRAGIALN